MKKNPSTTGFTLVELMVSISIFSLVMTLAMGSILTTLGANVKSKALRSVMDSVSFSLESMTRTFRFGRVYHCGGGDITTPRDCAWGENSMTVLDSSNRRVTYFLDTNTNRIMRVIDGGTADPMTASDVVITDLTFRVFGSSTFTSGDLYQPQAIILVGGYVQGKGNEQTKFYLQTTVSQRLLDYI